MDRKSEPIEQTVIAVIALILIGLFISLVALGSMKMLGML